MIKKNIYLIICIVSIVMLYGCTKNTINYRKILMDKGGEKIKEIVIYDFDNDGQKEAFAYVTKSLNSEEGEVKLWFVNGEESKLLDRSEFSEIDKNSFVRYKQFMICNLANNNIKSPIKTKVYYVKKGEVNECDNKVNNICKIGKEIYELRTSYCQYDNQLKKWMTTSEQYYHLNITHNIVERVSGRLIKQEDFDNYNNSKAIIKKIKNTLAKNHIIKNISLTFVKRKDNTIDINVIVSTAEKDKFKYYITVETQNNLLYEKTDLKEGNKDIN